MILATRLGFGIAIILRLALATAKRARILKLPDMNERFVAQGIDLVSSTPEAFGDLIKSEVPKWRKVIRDSGAKVD
jgi:tripartite-type tricarboxylate transporter receptor subunit TctC